ncbi:hypothetical protein WJX73_006456 [Symbiochloris irregularis]|uniref:Uncharacterized protein n=1 Tax=Symbiochloris irregularis TaxID=706552 RepID=A0AAW1P255_9CHLO
MDAASGGSFDHLFKVLLVGDSGVGKTSLLQRFSEGSFDEASPPTIGVDFRLKYVDLQGKRIKLTVWDTAGQERFRTLTSSYYRGAHGIVYLFDVTREETFEGIKEVWMPEVAMYSTLEHPATMVIANKIDLESEREVSREQATAFSRQNGCLFVETSAKADVAVRQAFEELLLKILDSPSLLKEGAAQTQNV